MGAVRRIWRNVVMELGRSKYYILLAALLFAFGIWIYMENADEFKAALTEVAAKIFGEAAEKITSSDDPVGTSIVFIFLNNVRAVFLMMLLGILLAVYPAVAMIVNGMFVGLVLDLQTSSGGSVGELIVNGLLPHGVLELPAVFMAAGYGIRLGATVVLRLIPRYRSRLQTVGEVFQSGVHLFGFIVVLLFLAAIIESTVTYWLLESMRA